MSERTVTTFTCDRCDAAEDSLSSEQPDGWVRVAPDGHRPRDLCARCKVAFWVFMASASCALSDAVRAEDIVVGDYLIGVGPVEDVSFDGRAWKVRTEHGSHMYPEGGRVQKAVMAP